MHPTLKHYTFIEGTPDSAAQFIESRRKYLEHIRWSREDSEFELLAEAIEKEFIPTIPPPPMPVKNSDPNDEAQIVDYEAEMIIWHEEIKLVAERRLELRQGLVRQYAVLKGQCSPSVMSRLTGEEGWKIVDSERNPIELIKRIRRVCYGFNPHIHPPVYRLAQAMKMLYTVKQKNETNENYIEGFEAICRIYEELGGSMIYPVLTERRAEEIAAAAVPPHGPEGVTDQDRQTASSQITNEMKVGILLSGANKRNYGSLKKRLERVYAS